MTIQTLYNLTAKACMIPNKVAKVYVDDFRKVYPDSKVIERCNVVLDEPNLVIVYNVTLTNGQQDIVKIHV